MPVSKNVILWLRGSGLRDGHDFIDNGQKDNNEKNGDTNIQSPTQGVSFSTAAANQNTSSPNKYRRYSSHE
eukprot:10450917-Ditylum_brightwellii.AAC.1